VENQFQREKKRGNNFKRAGRDYLIILKRRRRGERGMKEVPEGGVGCGGKLCFANQEQ
jgi:hypothetical protein